MIRPTVGRVVNFWPDDNTVRINGIVRLDHDQPMPATIVHVHNERLVNLVALDSDGYSYRMIDVKLLQDEERAPGERCAEWMPYQKGQAAKTEQLEQKIAGAS